MRRNKSKRVRFHQKSTCDSRAIELARFEESVKERFESVTDRFEREICKYDIVFRGTLLLNIYLESDIRDIIGSLANYLKVPLTDREIIFARNISSKRWS